MAADELVGDAQRAAHAAHLVLEQKTQRLDDLQVHLLGKTAHIVVRLDRGRRSVHRARLDDVGIDRTLRQPPHVADLHGLLVEYLDEVAADDLALLLGLGNPGQVAEELRTGLDALDVETHVLVRLEHLLELVLAQQARIDEDAVEVLADGLVQQDGGHRGIDTSRKAQHDLVIAQLLAQFAHGSLDEALRGPRLGASADACDEVLQELLAVGRMVDLGVELDTPRLLALDVKGGDAHIFRAGNDPVGVGDPRNRIAMRHPHLRGRRKVLHERILGIAHREHRASVFAARSRLHLAAEGVGQILCAVADAQQRQPPLDLREVGVGAWASRTEEGLPERITPRTEASIGGILLKGWISQ